MTLRGQNIYLRALEPEDLEFIYTIENDESVWEVSHTQTPYSRFLIRQYLENAHQDIYEAKQLRLAICKSKTAETIGLIDLFDFDPQNSRAGIGILIHQVQDRHKGVGAEALQLLMDYAFTHLQLHQLYANIAEDNQPSLQLFTKFGFRKIGVKKQWNKIGSQFKDEVLFQIINDK
ncbi:GNAT family N-acetyltransferase [Flavobacterium sp. NRK F10]|uniref:GNAT family N-acetyltransferase n=1 Tax=Flavobacterium sp. NRK F10 TaxID=2954931 RepID=UPI0020916C76|nr:GNAT family N-acetyltransferase [Flavobacterium sp. NRK F10]MCO6174040.1 GNAT family N-acetyltransferase [Flavobacterium sp. NRK F10]